MSGEKDFWRGLKVGDAAWCAALDLKTRLVFGGRTMDDVYKAHVGAEDAWTPDCPEEKSLFDLLYSEEKIRRLFGRRG